MARYIPTISLNGTTYAAADTTIRKIFSLKLKHFSLLCAPFQGEESQQPTWRFDVTYPREEPIGASFFGKTLWVRTPIFEVAPGSYINFKKPTHVLLCHGPSIDTYYKHYVQTSAGDYAVPSDVSYLCLSNLYDGNEEEVYAEIISPHSEEKKFFIEDSLCYSFTGVSGEERAYKAGEEWAYAWKSNNVVRGVAYPYEGDILYRDNPTQSAVVPFAIAKNGSLSSRSAFMALAITPGTAYASLFMMFGNNENMSGYFSDPVTFSHPFDSKVNGIRVAINSGNNLIVSYLAKNGDLRITDYYLGSSGDRKTYLAAYQRMEHVTGCTIQTGAAPNISYYGCGFPDYSEYARLIKDIRDDDDIVSLDGRVTALEEGGGGGGTTNWATGLDMLDYGQEYLGAFYNKLTSKQSFKVVLCGDSTTEYYKDTDYGINALLDACFRKYGITNGTIVNKGRSGTTTKEWLNNYLSQDIAENGNLYIIRYGFNNDVGASTIEEAANSFDTSMRAALTRLRAAHPVTESSIVLMMPNTSNDDAHMRGQDMKKALESKLRPIAREFGCAFIDTFRKWYDGGEFVNNMYYTETDPAFIGINVHPNGLQNRNIVSELFDFICPECFRKISGGGGDLIPVVNNHETRITLLEEGGGGTGARNITIRAKDLSKIGGTYMNAYNPNDMETFILPFYQLNTGSGTSLDGWNGYMWMRTPLFRVYNGQTITSGSIGCHLMYFSAVDLGSYISHVQINPNTSTTVPAGVEYASVCMTYNPNESVDANSIVAIANCGEFYLEDIFYEEEIVPTGATNLSMTAMFKPEGLFAVGSPDVVRGFAHPLGGNILYTDRPGENDLYPIAISTNGTNADFSCFMGVSVTRGSNTGKIYFMWSRHFDGYVSDNLVFAQNFEGQMNGIRGTFNGNILDITYINSAGQLRMNQASISTYWLALYLRMTPVTGVIFQTGSGQNISYYGRGFERYEDYYRFAKDIGDDSGLVNHETRIAALESGGGGGGGSGDVTVTVLETSTSKANLNQIMFDYAATIGANQAKPIRITVGGSDVSPLFTETYLGWFYTYPLSRRFSVLLRDRYGSVIVGSSSDGTNVTWEKMATRSYISSLTKHGTVEVNDIPANDFKDVVVQTGQTNGNYHVVFGVNYTNGYTLLHPSVINRQNGQFTLRVYNAHTDILSGSFDYIVYNM